MLMAKIKMAPPACVRAIRLLGRPLRISRSGIAASRAFSDSKDNGNVDKLDELLNSFSIKKHADAPKVTAAKQPKQSDIKLRGFSQKVVKAAREAAESLSGDIEHNHMRLLEKLQNVNAESRTFSVEDLFGGIKIYKTKSQTANSQAMLAELNELADKHAEPGSIHALKSRDRLQVTKELRTDAVHKYPLFRGPGHGIFRMRSFPNQVEEPITLWDKLEKYQLDLLVSVSPKNVFDEMIDWTEKGKLWKFPIDNEAGMEEEFEVSFEDHVFLEHLIDDEKAFPKGPLRDFMEVVCLSLSQNPYITVERKHAVIQWYRDYFDEHSKLIKTALES